MLPIVDYGGIAVVVPRIAAVGGIVQENDSFGFEVYLSGIAHPLAIFIGSREEAEQSRAELVTVIAHYHCATDCAFDFEEEDYEDLLDCGPDDIDREDTH